MRIAVLDIGGTAIKSALWDGVSLSEFQEQAALVHSAQALLSDAEAAVRRFGTVDALGVASRGQVSREGIILFDNGPVLNYTGASVKQMLTAALKCPVAVENDANAAALGEGRFGAAKGVPDYLCLTYGTGIGGAIVQNGMIYRGANDSAGEFGAMQLFSQESNGDGLCAAFYENFASASALVNAAMAVDPEIKNGRAVCEHMERPVLRPVIERWVRNVSYGLSTLIHIFNPRCVVLGGGIMENDRLFQKIAACTAGQLMPGFEMAELRQAVLGNRAGLIGAALLAEKLLFD
ncbi:MAG: ROK family protein [Clostridia bacterium]|nr:ROK family protein [Clostridia bacterium]